MSSDQTQADGMVESVSFEEAENYVQQRRQKEILDAAKRAIETWSTARQNHTYGEIDIETCRGVIRIAVEELIAETEQVMQRAGADNLWAEKPLGNITLQPPEDLVEFVNNSETKIWGEFDLSEETVYTVQGIKGYRDAPPAFTATWSVHADVSHEGPQQVTSTTEGGMPIKVSESVISEIKWFLNAAGLGVDAHLEPHTGEDGPGI